MKNSNIKRKFIHLFVFVIVFSVFGFMYYMSTIQRVLLLDAKKEGLQILANEKAYQLNTYLDTQKEKLTLLSSMSIFQDVIKNPANAVKISAATHLISELKNVYTGISILTNEGIVIVADVDLPGTDYSGQPYFKLETKKIVFELYYDSFRKKDFYAVVGPIYDNVEKTKVIGTIAFDLELNKIDTIMQETFDSESNEVYLINESGLLLSSSEYIGGGNKNGILIQEVKSEGAEICLEDLEKFKGEGEIEEHEEEIGGQYVNYMGNMVFGAHAYAPQIMGCVIAEEASGDVTQLSMWDYINKLFNK